MGKYAIGSRIKPRTSKFYRELMTQSELSQARRIIKGLRRTDTNGHCAEGAVIVPGRGRVRVCVSHGEITIGGLAMSGNATGATWSVENRTATVSETVCAAVHQGLFRTVNGGYERPNNEPVNGSTLGGEGSDGTGGDGEDNPTQAGSEDGGDQTGDQTNGESGDGSGQPGEDSDSDDASDQDETNASASGASTAEEREHDLEHLIRRLREIAEYLESDAAETSDRVSNRAFIDGARMLKHGIPVSGILHAFAINWPETAREAAGIEPWDPYQFGEPVEGSHRLHAYVKTLTEANVAVWLGGPSQSGKSYLAEQVCRDLGLDFRACPLTGGASSSWLLGAWTPQGFVDAGFPEVYENGGGFLFDEADAADPNMSVVLNNALTNGILENPRNGKLIRRSENFRAFAAANTWGTGATAEYTGRARVDAAVLERFRMGRVLVEYDRDLQADLARTAYGEGA